MASQENYVELRNVNKVFGNFKASDDVSFGIQKGQLVALLGPSGSGKTTILRMIAGLETPTSGDIYINGERVNDIVPADRGIGFLFQNYALFRYMTVEQNIAFGLEVKKTSKFEIKKRVKELVKLTGLEGLEKRYPNQLSGGQRQRVAFARAIAPNPGLLLLDEPFAALDAKVRQELRSWLRNIIHEVGITSIFVTHDQDEAIEVADQIIVTNHGRIEQIGSPEDIYQKPKTAFVSEFIGESALIENFRKLKGFNWDGYQNAIIRPEFVEAFKSDNRRFYNVIDCSQPGTVTDIIFRGNCLELKLNVNGVKLTTRRALDRRPVHVGELMNVLIYKAFGIDANGAHLLKNENLEGREIDGRNLDIYLYTDEGYLVV